MRDRDYYPAGAYDDPNAPYNQHENPERDFDVEVSVTLTRSTAITTTNYDMYFDYEDGHTYVETDNIDWQDEYDEQHMSIPDLLTKMSELLKKWKPAEMTRSERNLYKLILEEVDGWEESETEIIDHE